MNYHTDRTIMFCVIVVLHLINAIKVLTSIFEKGIFKDQRVLLMEKTNKELRSLLGKRKGIASLKKTELVELVLAA